MEVEDGLFIRLGNCHGGCDALQFVTAGPEEVRTEHSYWNPRAEGCRRQLSQLACQ